MKINLILTYILSITGLITVFISLENLYVLGITIMLFFGAIINYMDYIYIIRNED